MQVAYMIINLLHISMKTSFFHILKDDSMMWNSSKHYFLQTIIYQ